jgi:hypothetical protein
MLATTVLAPDFARAFGNGLNRFLEEQGNTEG